MGLKGVPVHAATNVAVFPALTLRRLYDMGLIEPAAEGLFRLSTEGKTAIPGLVRDEVNEPDRDRQKKAHPEG